MVFAPHPRDRRINSTLRAREDGRMDLKRLQYFCTIVEQGQISRAARVLHISQPPLSQRLKELEDELGVALILRDDHPWQVTEAGKVLYERARRVLAELAELPAEVKNAADGFSGRIVLGASTTCLGRVSAAIPALHATYPNVQFRVVVNDSAALELLMKQREIDFAVLLLPLEDDAAFEIRPLPRDAFSVVSPTDLGLPPEGVRIADLAEVPLLALRRSTGGGTWDHLMKAFQRENVEARVVLDSPDVYLLVACLDAGMPAAAVVPSTQVSAGIRERFRVAPLLVEAMTLQPALVHLKDRYLSSAACATIEAICASSPAR
jgi:DNA-binding transcriptional LysR family regulator